MLQCILGYMYLFKLWFLPDMCPGVGLLDDMVALFLFLVFLRNSILFSVEIVLIYIPTNSIGNFLLSTPSLTFIVCKLFDVGNSDQCEVVYLKVVLIWISLIISDVGHLFVWWFFIYLFPFIISLSGFLVWCFCSFSYLPYLIFAYA